MRPLIGIIIRLADKPTGIAPQQVATLMGGMITRWQSSQKGVGGIGLLSGRQLGDRMDLTRSSCHWSYGF
jgi:hypothetical protein